MKNMRNNYIVERGASVGRSALSEAVADHCNVRSGSKGGGVFPQNFQKFQVHYEANKNFGQKHQS